MSQYDDFHHIRQNYPLKSHDNDENQFINDLLLKLFEKKNLQCFNYSLQCWAQIELRKFKGKELHAVMLAA